MHRVIPWLTVILAFVSSVGAAQHETFAASGLRWVVDPVIIDHTGGYWPAMIRQSVNDWSALTGLDFTTRKGEGECGYVEGAISVCSGNYGVESWIGHAYWQPSGNTIVSAYILLDTADHKGDNKHLRQATVCHELGHALGHEGHPSDDADSCLVGGSTRPTRPGSYDAQFMAALYASEPESTVQTTEGTPDRNRPDRDTDRTERDERPTDERDEPEAPRGACSGCFVPDGGYVASQESLEEWRRMVAADAAERASVCVPDYNSDTPAVC